MRNRAKATESSIDHVAQFAFRFPKRADRLEQNEEWCEAMIEGEWRTIRFHDYGSIFAVPGLYEALFYERLKCCSPARVVGLLSDVLSDSPQSGSDLRALDVGAGNGLVGHELRCLGAPLVIGVDLLPEARAAALRDRPGVYDDYLVADLTTLDEAQRLQLEQLRLNCMTCVAALGFGDIPTQAFLAAYDLIETSGWLAFNLRDNFLDESVDSTGFAGLIRRMRREGVIQVQAYRRYQHRLAASGAPLHYIAMVALKQAPVPTGWLEA